ncbi:MAG TPA: dihydrodipicolinate synthase family protein, partial [Chlamydiales bacterium]|nr:dihydrodipicolinate synthase family protein [Chlamydiales bacterium]
PDALDLANFATGFGFFAGLLPPMIYGNDAQMVISQFISKTKTPLFLYNPPPFIGTIIPDIAPFVGHEQILGIKDSPSAYDVLERLVKRFRSPSFYVYTGREDHLETAFQIDLDGLVSGSANVFPELFMRVWKQRDSASLEELKRSKQYLAQLHPGDYIQCLKMELQKRRIIQ